VLDHMQDVKVELAQLRETTRAAVRPMIAPELAVENPLECSVSGLGYEKVYLEIVRLYAEDEGVDLVGINGELPRDGQRKDASDWAEVATSCQKPIVAFGRAPYCLTEESRVFQDQAGMPFLQAIRPTLRALRALGFYGVCRNNTLQVMPPAVGKEEELDERLLYETLHVHGVTAPRQAFATRPTEAVSMAEEIGFPVALKLIAPDLIHKTESGAVVLDVRDAREVRMHAARLLGYRASPSKLLVQEMVSGTEVILGARCDPQFGPFIVVGMGGVFVDIIEDVALRLLPVSEDEAAAMLRELKGFRIFEGFRGQRSRDIGALCGAIAGLSAVFAAHRSYISDLEINPLVVRETGSGVIAVDVKIIRNPMPGSA